MGFGEAVSVQVENLPDFWTRVRKSEHRLLALDYDGTLAPFHVDPMRAYPLPGIPALLDALGRARNTTVAIISGRPVQELNTLLGDVDITLIGCHGFELIDRDGNLTVKSPNREQLEGMERAIDAAVRLGLHGKLEIKTASIALHTRGMPENEASRIEEMILRVWSGGSSLDLGCRRFNGGVEMYCTGWNKADAMNDLLRTQPPEALPVYIGDDTTDEDVFLMLRESGIGIKVGLPGTTTAARGFLPSCEAVRTFLESWLSL
jgi:trehalose-phosphatase